MGGFLRRLGYRRARLLLLFLGLLVLGLIAVVNVVRGVETVEVVATVLFIPVFVGGVLWGVWGGAVAGVLAAATYAILRIPAIQAVGADPFIGLLVTRGVALVLFGLIVGWAAGQVGRALRKLEEQDQVDDLTGLLNARFFLQETDLEIARSARYQTVFSVVAVDVAADAVAALSRPKRKLRELARELRDSVRTVDRVVHALDGDRHVIAVILPETGPEGARTFTVRMAERVARHLGSGGGPLPADTYRQRSWTYPGDEEGLRAFREELRLVAAQE
ncbi:MAG: GGDEF domain-containing protein, partial [Actinomycetota bacterium]|nr:GGDEF domain-containing protein [Actinomycetota bacterium]